MKFSRTAAYYHLLERFFIGSALQRTRVSQLNKLSLCRNSCRLLIVGEGNGRFLLEFLKGYPDASVTVIDESAEMLELAKKRLQRAGISHQNVEFKVADLRAVELPENVFDLIVTHFFFTNFPEAEVAEMVSALSCSARPNSEWLLGDFTMPCSGWRRLRARMWLKILYGFFAWTAKVPVRELPEIERYLIEEGFQLEAAEAVSFGLLRSARLRRE